MTKRDEHQLLLSDTAVPDLFIADHMALLDEFALKVYLMLLQGKTRSDQKIERESLAARLGITVQKVDRSLNILEQEGLLRQTDGAIELVDLKHAEVSRFVKNREALVKVTPGEVSKRERVVGIINDTYFQGTMSYRWYALIDGWFEKYMFEPDVVYTLFSELVERNKLNHVGYAASIAENWHKNGIKTFEQLSMHQDKFKENYAFCARVARSLRIKLDEYNEPLIRKWNEELGYDFTVVELALKQSVRMNNAKNLTIYDKMLREWHAAGLKDKASVEAHEAVRRASAGKKPAGPARDNRGNYRDQGDVDAYKNDISDGLRPLRVKREDD